jgi:hypothetical protein
MTKRTDPASQVLTYFETAPVESASTVLAICKGIVSRRQQQPAPAAGDPPAARKTPSTPRRRRGSGTDAEPAPLAEVKAAGQ